MPFRGKRHVPKGQPPALEAQAAKNRGKTTCPKGHPYDTANTYVDRKGFRHCRACMKLATARWKEAEFDRKWGFDL